MILELDAGNSRIKWRQIRSDSMELINAGIVPEFSDLEIVPELQYSVKMVRLCSVRGRELNIQLQDWVSSSYGLDLQVAEVTQSCGGVTNQYKDVSRLGIDRWLALLAAYKRTAGACVVVDAGTAFTIDLLDAQGLHLGGYILPGLQLMRSSLESATAIRLTPGHIARPQAAGHSTDQAVSNGTLTALLAMITQIMHSINSQQVATKLYFTGGDAELLHAHASIEGSEVVPGLVFEGLAVACPYLHDS